MKSSNCSSRNLSEYVAIFSQCSQMIWNRSQSWFLSAWDSIVCHNANTCNVQCLKCSVMYCHFAYMQFQLDHITTFPNEIKNEPTKTKPTQQTQKVAETNGIRTFLQPVSPQIAHVTATLTCCTVAFFVHSLCFWLSLSLSC